MPECFVCKSPCLKCKKDEKDIFDCNCDTCGGEFGIYDDFFKSSRQHEEIERYIISAFINEVILRYKIKPYIFPDKNATDSSIKNVYDLNDIVTNFPTTVKDTLDRILLNIHEKTTDPGKAISFPAQRIHRKLSMPFFYAKDSKVALFYLKALQDHSYVEYNEIITDSLDIKLTVSGFNSVYDIQSRDPKLSSKDVFVALDFNHRGVYDNAIKEILKKLGFNPKCMLDHKKSENIDNAIKAGILNSRFIIVDLTNNNNGAYWEAGFGFGLGKEVILCCKKKADEKVADIVHFDQNHFKILFYESYEELKKELVAWMESIPGLIPESKEYNAFKSGDINI